MERLLNLDLQKRWGTFSIYEKFEHLIITLLTAIIAAIVGAATWQLILHTFDLVRSHLVDPRDSQVFQTVFGMVLTVLIAMEFKHSLLVVLHQQRDIVQIRSVVLIALLAMVRKFIILDIYQTQPAVVFALAAASLSLGIVFWLVRDQDEPRLPSEAAPETEANVEPAPNRSPVNAIQGQGCTTRRTDRTFGERKFTTMLTRNHLVRVLPLFLWTALISAQSLPGSASHHRQVQIPNRPAALFIGEQGKQRTEIHFDPATSEVTTKLLVQDPAGYFIPGLHRDNFAVYENGVRQQNATVEIEHAPITLGIVMEHGGRYKGFNRTSSDEVLRAGQQILDELGREDKVAIWEYADSVHQVADFTTAHDRLDRFFMSSAVPDSSETNFYDALVSTSEAMKTVTGRKALIVITSGVDTFSKAKYDNAINAVRASGTPVYIINLGPDLREAAKNYANAGPYAHLDWRKTEGQLREIASVSGGRMYAESSTIDLTGVYDDLIENLRVRYVISYRSTCGAPLDAARTVRVELVDTKTNGPLEIVDVNGRVIRSTVIVENSYVPSASS